MNRSYLMAWFVRPINASSKNNQTSIHGNAELDEVVVAFSEVLVFVCSDGCKPDAKLAVFGRRLHSVCMLGRNLVLLDHWKRIRTVGLGACS